MAPREPADGGKEQEGKASGFRDRGELELDHGKGAARVGGGERLEAGDLKRAKIRAVGRRGGGCRIDGDGARQVVVGVAEQHDEAAALVRVRGLVERNERPEVVGRTAAREGVGCERQGPVADEDGAGHVVGKDGARA